MKHLILVLLLAPCLQQAQSWVEIIDSHTKIFQNRKDDPDTYPLLSDHLRQLYSDTATITRIDRYIGGKLKNSSELYITDDQIEFVQTNEGWNLSTDDEWVYEWQVGSDAGYKYKRNDLHLIEYARYVTNLAGILTSVYGTYRLKPDIFEISAEPRRDYLRYTVKVQYRDAFPIEAIFVSYEPFWLHGLEAVRNDTRKRIMVSEPRPIESIPASILNRKSDITFEVTDRTLEARMTYF